MTKSQRHWIEKIGLAGDVSKDRIPPDTYLALLGHGLIEVKADGFFKKVSLTLHGKEIRLNQVIK